MIPPEAEAIMRGDAQAAIAVRNAIFVAVDGKSAQVDMGDSRFLCDFGSGYVPAPGETVRIWSVGGQHLLFPAGPRPTVGTVTTVSSTSASVQTSVGVLAMPFAGSAPSSGDRVGIVWSEDGPWCTSKLSSTVPPPGPTPDPGGGNILRSATFRVTDAGSTDRDKPRWWTGQPRAGNSTYGAWFYGTQIKDTIPAGAVVVSVEIYVSWHQRKGSAPNFALHNQASKGAVPTFSGVTAWAPGDGWQVVPDQVGWFNALKAGGPWWGVGLNQGGDNIFRSLAQDSMSGALRIAWRS